MRNRYLLSGAFSSLGAMLNRVRNTKPVTPMLEYNDHGQVVIHLNELVPVGGRCASHLPLNTLLGLMESCFRNQHWKVTSAQFMNIRKDMIERLPALMCDIGGLFAYEVDIILGCTSTPAAYRLDHRVRNTAGLMKHTETFTFENTNNTIPTEKEKDTMNEQPNTQTDQRDTFIVELNQFLNQGGLVDVDYLRQYMLNAGNKFFVDGSSVVALLTEITPSLGLLSTLTMRHNVVLTIYAKREPGHPGWDFKCTPRKTLGDHDGDRPLNAGFGGVWGRYYQPNMGMYNGPYGDIDNGMLCELLNLYSLTQIQSLPYQARGRNFPAGLELLDLVKERLGSNSFGLQQTMMPNMFNMSMPNMGMEPNGPGYSATSFGGMDQIMPRGARAQGTHGEAPNERYTRVVTGIKTFGLEGLDTTPPIMVEGDEFLAMALDNTVGRLYSVAVNRGFNSYSIYQATRMGNLIDRTTYPIGKDLAAAPVVSDLLRFLDLPTSPYQTFTFSVADKMEDTLCSIKDQIQWLMLKRHQHDQLIGEVEAVLAVKPISSSDVVELKFSVGHPAFFPEGLRAALPSGDAHVKYPRGSLTGAPLAWVIHTELSERGEDFLPERFWVLDTTVTSRCM